MPSLLAITSELPWPLNTGGHLRTFYLLRSMARTFQVRLLTAVAEEQEPAVAALREHGIEVCPARVRVRTRTGEAWRAMVSLARRDPYVMFGRHDRPAVRETLRQSLAHATPDALYLDHLDSFAFRPLLPPRPMVIDLHNVYSTLVERAAVEDPRWWARAYLRREARLLGRREENAVREVDAVLAVSRGDAQYYRARGARDVTVVPNGVDCAAYEILPTGRTAKAPLVLYVGAMSWAPNVHAAQFLAREVMPEVRRRVPGARLRVVGRDPTPEVLSLRNLAGVEVTGTVAELTPHLGEASVLAVPLEAGGGTRLKILEGFAAGLPVVSTPVGCEGLDAEGGRHLIIAERPDFASRIIDVLSDSRLGRTFADEARTLAREVYDWARVGELACAVLNRLLAVSSADRECPLRQTGRTG